MEKILIHKDKPNEFKCNLLIEGANIHNTKVRLCLEFKDRTVFFNGDLHSNGDCDITIPKLKDLNESDGTLYVEVIADGTYFRVYEDKFYFKNSIEVKLNESTSSGFLQRKESSVAPSVKFTLNTDKDESEPILEKSKSDKTIKPKHDKTNKSSVLSYDEYIKKFS